MEPGDGRIRQAGHLALQHRLLPLDHIQVVERLDEVGHGEALHLVLRDLGLLWDGGHLLQFGPEREERRGSGRNISQLYEFQANNVFLHLRGDGRPRLLDVEFSRVLGFSVSVSGSDGVKTFVVTRYVGNNERMAAALLDYPDVFAFDERLV